MSASLVGSEMCIRDRGKEEEEEEVMVVVEKKEKWRSTTRERWGRRIRRITVSYTHLTLPTICSV
eukprot:12761989-Alexandrium_andersonii.AAC.1